MAARALLIGIDAYAKDRLHGCVNDVLAMRRLLSARFGAKELRLLRDQEATRAAILEGLQWLLDPRAGAWCARLFHFSGHGTYLDNQDGREPDGRDEVLCPVDFAFRRARLIMDDDLSDLFGHAPPGTRPLVIVDACHAGTMLDPPRQVVVPRAQIVPPKRALVVPVDPLLKMRAVDPPTEVRERCEAARLRWETELAIVMGHDGGGSLRAASAGPSWADTTQFARLFRGARVWAYACDTRAATLEDDLSSFGRMALAGGVRVFAGHASPITAPPPFASLPQLRETTYLAPARGFRCFLQGCDCTAEIRNRALRSRDPRIALIALSIQDAFESLRVLRSEPAP